jgi:hypothetical protein
MAKTKQGTRGVESYTIRSTTKVVQGTYSPLLTDAAARVAICAKIHSFC